VAYIYVGESSVEAKTTADNDDITGKKDSLKKDSEIHSDDDVYSCGECEKCFSSQASSNQHALIHRLRQKCTECGRSFHSKKALLMHSVRIHRMRQTTSEQISTGSASVKCSHVNKATSANANASNLQAEAETKTDNTDITGRKDSLKKDRESHSEDDVYSCGECEKCFSTQASLNQHVNLLHRSRCKCTECGKMFHGKNRKMALLMHIRIHRMRQTMSQQISTGITSAKSSDVDEATSAKACTKLLSTYSHRGQIVFRNMADWKLDAQTVVKLKTEPNMFVYLYCILTI